MALIGFILLMAGGFLIYSGIKSEHPVTLTQQAISTGTVP